MIYLNFNSWCFPGDGGNDVSMIQAADCGIGIEGKVGVCFRHTYCTCALSSVDLFRPAPSQERGQQSVRPFGLQAQP